MRYPPRLSHLATLKVVVAKLVPTYAASHHLDDEEAMLALEAALSRGPLLDDLLAATWTALQGTTKRLKEEGLLEKVARTLQDRPLRPGRLAEVSPAWSAFLVVVDIAAGRASDAARKVMEAPEGARMAEAGIAEAGRFLAKELTRS